jgi:hypothetical protein
MAAAEVENKMLGASEIVAVEGAGKAQECEQ